MMERKKRGGGDGLWFVRERDKMHKKKKGGRGR